MNILRSFWNSPTDLKTTHFWDPAFNWSLPFACSDVCLFGTVREGFAWMVRPPNPHLLVCHASNETVQLYQLSRWFRAQRINGFYFDVKEPLRIGQ
ncbi:Serine/threonine-protein phosphatase 7 long form-like isoform B [Glycine soja]|uniref:Mitochondrial pyruvate carrier n=1 Tax=Glycine soja TaxID=3848 RepID=A0A445FDW2_GLYSO|nr:Serine/threonine-protein phosphatase 7 long form-like isoform B [Glycine soja]